MLNTANDMKNTYITVVGNMPVKFDLDQTKHLGPLIGSSNSNKAASFDYATVNSELNLQDMLNSANFKDSHILTTEELYKK